MCVKGWNWGTAKFSGKFFRINALIMSEILMMISEVKSAVNLRLVCCLTSTRRALKTRSVVSLLTVLFPPFTGPLLSFEVNDNTAFEIPLSNVSQCATGKNEVTLEFHQNDDTEVSLMEVRFYVPPSQSDERQDPVEVTKDALLLLFCLFGFLCFSLFLFTVVLKLCVFIQAFAQNVLSKADVIQATGDAVCIFKELQCLTPRGR